MSLASCFKVQHNTVHAADGIVSTFHDLHVLITLSVAGARYGA